VGNGQASASLVSQEAYKLAAGGVEGALLLFGLTAVDQRAAVVIV